MCKNGFYNLEQSISAQGCTLMQSHMRCYTAQIFELYGGILMAIVTAENLTKHYGAGTNPTKALDGVSLTIAEGELPPSLAHPAAGNPPCRICLAVLTGRILRQSPNPRQGFICNERGGIDRISPPGNRLCFSKLQSGARAQCAGKHCASG